MRRFRTSSLVLFVFILALATRFAFVAIRQPYRGNDGAEMMRAARTWARDWRIGGIFRDDPGESAHVAPLYPMIMGSVFRAAGATAWPG